MPFMSGHAGSCRFMRVMPFMPGHAVHAGASGCLGERDVPPADGGDASGVNPSDGEDALVVGRGVCAEMFLHVHRFSFVILDLLYLFHRGCLIVGRVVGC